MFFSIINLSTFYNWQFIEVQPNDGFGKILPKETLKLDVIFKAQKACNYDVTVSLKNEFGQKWDLRVLATGVLPPLTLSHQVWIFMLMSQQN